MKTQIAILTLFLVSSAAQADCPPGELPTVIIGGNTVGDPILTNDPCPCVGWDASTGAVSHYHLRIDGSYYIETPIPRVEVCLPAKNTSFGLDVYAVAQDEAAISQVSATTYVEWQDRICEVVTVETVPPNVDGTCPVGSTEK